jgi:hypothetical protein
LESGASKDYDGRVRRIPLGLKLAFSLWVVLWAPIYAFYPPYGPTSFLWFCDLGNLMMVPALWLESALLVSWVSLSVLLVQGVWTIDFLSRLVSGVHVIGGSEYMWDPKIPLGIRLLSLFHVAMPPLLVFALRRLGYDRRAFLAQTLTAWAVLPICFFFTDPAKNLNWVFGLWGRAQTSVSPGIYLLATMAGYVVLLYLPGHLLLRRLFKAPSAS